MRRIEVIVRDYKRGQPWVVEREHDEVIEVPDGEPFWTAADRAWPREHHSVQPVAHETVL